MRTTLPAAVLGATLMAATSALAWSEDVSRMMQPATNEMPIYAYPSKHNYCPAGLQPVVVGGVICCGAPTHAAQVHHPAPRRHAPRVTHRASAPYVAYGKGYSGN